MKLAATALALGAALALASADALAVVQLRVRPLFGEDCVGRTTTGELVVTVENPGAAPVAGTLVVDVARPNPRGLRTVRAVGVSVPGRSRATVRVASWAALPGNELVARFVNADGRILGTETIALTQGVDAAVIDATPGSRFALAQRAPVGGALGVGTVGISVGLGAEELSYEVPVAAPTGAEGESRRVTCAVDRDAATGEAELPRTDAGYAHASLVLMDTATLTALGASEVTALADYVIRGGALALVVAHPGDLAHPTVSAFAGRGVTAAHAAERARPTRWVPQLGWPQRAPEERPLDATLAGAATYRGGHMRPGDLAALWPAGGDYALGASAAYGDGVVHLLAWDPARAPAVDDPWSSRAIQRLAEAGASRAAEGVFAAVPDTTPVPAPVRAWLTQRSAFRPALARMLGAAAAWAVAAALALALAGRRRALALALLPFAGLAAAAVLGRRADAARSADGAARAVAVIDLHAGMTRGTLRRYVGLTSADRALTALAAPEERRAIVADPESGAGRVVLVRSQDQSALTGVVLAPAVTFVAREEGLQTLPGAVSIAAEGDRGVRVTNRLPYALEDVVVSLGAGGDVRSFGRVGAGGTRLVAQGRRCPPEVAARFGSTELTELVAWEDRTPERAPASLAPGAAGPRIARWFGRPAERATLWDAVLAVPDVPGRPDRWASARDPMLVARVAWSPSARVGALRVERDEVWLRVHGYGGAP